MHCQIMPIFPALKAVLQERAESSLAEQASQLLQAIEYHHDFMFDSAAQARSLSSPCLGYNGVGIHLVVRGEDIIMVIPESLKEIPQRGDVTIREAATIIDIALLLTNQVTGIGIQQDLLSWKSTDRRKGLKIGLEARGGHECQDLVSEISKVWDSIGLFLMQAYRNWVTHRGAPKLVLAPGHTSGYQIPATILEIEQEVRRKFYLEKYLREVFNEDLSIACAPFYPKIIGFLNLTVTEEDNPIPELCKVTGGGTITFQNTALRTANMLENKDAYLAKHQVDVHQHEFNYGGEKLQVYKIQDYLSALQHICRFIQDSLTGGWDRKLASIMSARLDAEIRG